MGYHIRLYLTLGACHEQEDLDACLRVAAQESNRGPHQASVNVSLAKEIFTAQDDSSQVPSGDGGGHDQDGEPAHDLLRQRVEQPYQLAGNKRHDRQKDRQPPGDMGG